MDPISQQLMMGAAGSGGPKLYVEDVFSTWLYTGNGSTQTITNGIDLSGKGGLVWLKSRSNATPHILWTTGLTTGNLNTTNTDGLNTGNASLYPTWATDGFSMPSTSWVTLNQSGATYASWTFRKAAKFFDVVTYTGNGASQTIAHNLGSVPGCIIVKRTNASSDWAVYHRSLATNEWLLLNDTSAKVPNGNIWNSTAPTSTVFSVGSDGTSNFNGQPYVAYLFAHDAGGFGDSGNDSVVKCGSFTTPSSGSIDVDLGWEPQWLLVKASSNTGGWFLFDNMRGWAVGSNDQVLQAHLSDAEFSGGYGNPIATGFTTAGLNSSQTFIYIAIRRGPMKTPTDATKVFTSIAASGSTGTARSIGFPSDFMWARRRDFSYAPIAIDRLRGYSATSGGSQPALETTNTGAENAFTTALVYDAWNDTAKDGALLGSTSSALWYHFRRAPGFFDVVAYTGTGSTTDNPVSHNLGVAPELIFCKKRSASGNNWPVYQKDFTIPSNGGYGWLNNNSAFVTASNFYYLWGKTTPTATTFYVSTDGGAGNTNDAGATYIAYLFASCPGVSKVGSYTGTGTTLSIDCGFTNGARFALIKRTDSTGDWYVWDTARGIIAANDPYLLLNSTAAEITNTDYIDPLSSGFQISSTAPAAINASGGSFIYLAIA